MRAVKLQVTIPQHRRIQLPEDVPEGRAEVILLYPDASTAGRDVAELASPSAVPGPQKRRAAARATALRPASGEPPPLDYFERLTARQAAPLSAAASRTLDEADRGER